MKKTRTPAPPPFPDLAGLSADALALEAARCDARMAEVYRRARAHHEHLDWLHARREAALSLRGKVRARERREEKREAAEVAG